MMRSLWTAASGMVAQQTNLDTISDTTLTLDCSVYPCRTEALEVVSVAPSTTR